MSRHTDHPQLSCVDCGHKSDCATHNDPAMEPGPCDCGRKQVIGQRSPRWALWKRMTIPCENGLMYLARLRVIQTPWFGIYVHDIFEPDADRDPHNHPWSFISIVLRGSYAEVVFDDPLNDLGTFRWGVRKRWSWHVMGRKSAHRIVNAQTGLKTLIFVGPRRSDWGFFTDKGYVSWQTYEKVEGY